MDYKRRVTEGSVSGLERLIDDFYLYGQVNFGSLFLSISGLDGWMNSRAVFPGRTELSKIVHYYIYGLRHRAGISKFIG